MSVVQKGTRATIANGASQSNVINLQDRWLVGLVIPAGWTAAAITLLASDTEGGTYNPVHDQAGAEVTIAVGISRYITLQPDLFAGLRYVKLQSGTTALPVNQAAERVIQVLVRGMD